MWRVRSVSQLSTGPEILFRAEQFADNTIHVAGVTLGIAGAIWLALTIPHLETAGKALAVAIYGAALIAMLAASAAYNMWPHRPLKGWLRRIDHSAIYVFALP